MATYNPSSYGADVFGTKPSPLATPDLLAELRRVIPGYGSITSGLSNNLLSGLRGELSPEVARNVMDAANAHAVGGGYGGSGLGRNLTNRDLGLTSKAIQDMAFGQGLNYITNQKNAAVLDPGLRAEIEKYNSLVGAAPDPVARGNFEVEQADKYYNRSNRPLSPLFNPQQSAGTPNVPFPTMTQPNLTPTGGSGTRNGPIVGEKPIQPALNWDFLKGNGNGTNQGQISWGDVTGQQTGWLSPQPDNTSLTGTGEVSSPYDVFGGGGKYGFDWTNPSSLFDTSIYGGGGQEDPFSFLDIAGIPYNDFLDL